MSTNNFGSNFVTVVSFYLQNHEYGFFMLGDTCGSFDTAGQPYPSILNELDIVEGQCDQNFTLFFSGIEKKNTLLIKNVIC